MPLIELYEDGRESSLQPPPVITKRPLLGYLISDYRNNVKLVLGDQYF